MPRRPRFAGIHLPTLSLVENMREQNQRLPEIDMSQKIDPTARRIIIWAILLVLSLALFGISVLAQTHLSNNAATLSTDQVNLSDAVVLWCGLPGIFSATILIILALNADETRFLEKAGLPSSPNTGAYPCFGRHLPWPAEN
ncbi:hypothetical protein [Auritidibacter ignavus]|uniref:hypothetical protein n=2 Tax=Micrococcaceae TaxID=1268 RepID=UPI000D72ECDE|nr:hypothetical protein [Auritidibacter ignavus]WGH89043.1 hypothetical protein QDX22_02820 [Auritidibacter ignavus]